MNALFLSFREVDHGGADAGSIGNHWNWITEKLCKKYMKLYETHEFSSRFELIEAIESILTEFTLFVRTHHLL